MIKKLTFAFAAMVISVASYAQSQFEWKEAKSGGYTYKYVTNDPTQARFYTLKKELDVVDDELDHLDDEFEHTYENGKLSFKTYKSREKTIEKLEDQLDLLEDALENKFGIDD